MTYYLLSCVFEGPHSCNWHCCICFPHKVQFSMRKKKRQHISTCISTEPQLQRPDFATKFYSKHLVGKDVRGIFFHYSCLFLTLAFYTLGARCLWRLKWFQKCTTTKAYTGRKKGFLGEKILHLCFPVSSLFWMISKDSKAEAAHH